MAYSLRLERLLATVEAGPDLTSGAMARALTEVPLELDGVAPFVSFRPQNYRRNLVVRRARFELRALCWLPNQRTSLHAHGRSVCAFRVLSGTSTEIRLGRPDRRWEPGEVVREDCPGLVHQIANLGDVPLVSLHAYSPPLPIDQPPATYEGRHVVVVGGGIHLQADPLGLGVLTDDAGRALDHHGRASSWLYTLGGLRRPRLWETTSVPDIVRQAVALAELLTREPQPGAASVRA